MNQINDGVARADDMTPGEVIDRFTAIAHRTVRRAGDRLDAAMPDLQPLLARYGRMLDHAREVSA